MSLSAPSAVSSQIVRELNAPRAHAPAAPLRICHLSMTLRTGGLEKLLVDFARFHDPAAVELRFVALAELGPPADELQRLGFAVDSLQLPRDGKQAALRKLAALLRHERIDLLHTHNTYPQFYGARAAWSAGRVPVINTQHGRGCGAGWKSLLQFRLANFNTRRVIGVSRDAQRLCQRQAPESRHKIDCIWNGIDVDRFAFSGPKLAPIAISVARLSPEKDFSTLLHATRRVVDRVPEFRLRLVGDGVERPKLEALARQLDLTRNVEFLGERHDVPELLRTAGFFVSSSKTEGVSLTLLEAMAVGLPIVTTRVGGNPEVVAENVTGLLSPAENPDALAERMLEMLSRQHAWPAIAAAARERVERNFNARTMVAQYEELYRDIATARP